MAVGTVGRHRAVRFRLAERHDVGERRDRRGPPRRDHRQPHRRPRRRRVAQGRRRRQAGLRRRRATGAKVAIARDGVWNLTATGAIAAGDQVIAAANGTVSSLAAAGAATLTDINNARAIVGIALEAISNGQQGPSSSDCRAKRCRPIRKHPPRSASRRCSSSRSGSAATSRTWSTSGSSRRALRPRLEGAGRRRRDAVPARRVDLPRHHPGRRRDRDPRRLAARRLDGGAQDGGRQAVRPRGAALEPRDPPQRDRPVHAAERKLANNIVRFVDTQAIALLTTDPGITTQAVRRSVDDRRHRHHRRDREGAGVDRVEEQRLQRLRRRRARPEHRPPRRPPEQHRPARRAPARDFGDGQIQQDRHDGAVPRPRRDLFTTSIAANQALVLDPTVAGTIAYEEPDPAEGFSATTRAATSRRSTSRSTRRTGRRTRSSPAASGPRWRSPTRAQSRSSRGV
jgi:hypothetical protein